MMENNFFTVDESAVVFERYDDEIIAINLNTGIYYTLNTTAADIFDLLAAGCPATDLITILQPKYSDDLRQFESDLAHFVSELKRAALIEPSPANRERPGVQTPENGPKVFFEVPVLKVHEDLQELFLLDPVHEVSAEGWPAPQGSQA
jgi:hypothetical protein